MSYERKMKKRGMAKLDEIVPNNYAKRPRFPIWAKVVIPLGSLVLASSIALAIALPLTLNKGPHKDGETLDNLILATGAASDDAFSPRPYPTFKNVLEGYSSLLKIKSGYDSSVKKKIALTIPSDVLKGNYHYREYGNTLDAWFMYYGGCIHRSDFDGKVSAYVFPFLEKIPTFINNEEVVGVYYVGEASIEEDVLDDLDIEYPLVMDQYYKADCSIDGDFIVETPHYGIYEALYFRDYRITPSLLPGFRLYQLDHIASLDDGAIDMVNAPRFQYFFDYDDDPNSYIGHPFHLLEFEPYLDGTISKLPYADFKAISLQYKDFYRNEVSFDVATSIYEEVDYDKGGYSTAIYRDYLDYASSPLPSWGCLYEEEFFDENLLVTYTLLYQGEYGVYWDEVIFERAYRKGDETYLEIKVTEPKEPKKEYARTIVIEVNDADLATPSYDPLVLCSFGG